MCEDTEWNEQKKKKKKKRVRLLLTSRGWFSPFYGSGFDVYGVPNFDRYGRKQQPRRP